MLEHPVVAEAAAVPAPGPVRLAVPKAYIALAPGHEPKKETACSILKHAHEKLNPYQRVRRIEFYPLPKTISGKIRRVELPWPGGPMSCRRSSAARSSSSPRPTSCAGG